MDSFILGGEEMEYWDAYNEQRERQGIMSLVQEEVCWLVKIA